MSKAVITPELAEFHALSQRPIAAVEAPKHPTYANIGMVFGALMVERSCALMLPDQDACSAAKRDLWSRPDIFIPQNDVKTIPAAGSIQGGRTIASSKLLQCLESFVSERPNEKLIVIDRVDFSGRSGNGSPEVLEYLSAMLNCRTKPMICAVGSESGKRLYNANKEPAGESLAFLGKLSVLFTQSESGQLTYGDGTLPPRHGYRYVTND